MSDNHADPTPCAHRGPVKPVVVKLAADGTEGDLEVVCQGCMRAIKLDAVPFERYDEREDGWYYPAGALRDEAAAGA